MLHNTKGIVLRVTKYGDTSIIMTAYTELFGVQQYIVKGVRVNTKKGANKGVFYQPAAILQMEVYHSPMKQLQMVKEVSWDFIYQNIYSDILRSAVATYIVEVLQQTMQPEPHPELFYLIEDTFKQLDKGGPGLVSNLPIYFLIHFLTIQNDIQYLLQDRNLVHPSMLLTIQNHEHWNNPSRCS